MERWANKTAVVTGASAGIGASIAVALANAGVNVVGFARRPHLIQELQEQVNGTGKIHGRGCDVSKPEDITEAFDWVEQDFGGVDILVNNAAVLYHGYITDFSPSVLTESEVISSVDVNVTGAILCTKRAIASMKKRNFDGHIVNINSIAGHYVPIVGVLNIYTSTKYAITAFTQALASELAELGQKIKTTSISPGLVATEMGEFNRMPELKDVAKACPKLEPSEVADAVIYALSTPPQVNICELTIQAVGEKKL